MSNATCSCENTACEQNKPFGAAFSNLKVYVANYTAGTTSACSDSDGTIDLNIDLCGTADSQQMATVRLSDVVCNDQERETLIAYLEDITDWTTAKDNSTAYVSGTMSEKDQTLLFSISKLTSARIKQ